jgi:hypothetical protein
VLALAVFGTLAAPVLAEQTKFHVRPTIKLKRTAEKDQFTGTLRSKERGCEANRKVKLHHRNVTQQGKSGVIATVKTNSKGKWTFVPKKNPNGIRYATPGTYTAKVGQKKVSTGHGEVVCRSKNSSGLLVG